MALFVLRYTSSLLIFSLGIHAPGIRGNPPSSYHSFEDDANNRSRFYQGVSHMIFFLTDCVISIVIDCIIRSRYY